jgi:putative hydrolase of the HAD superfamily
MSPAVAGEPFSHGPRSSFLNGYIKWRDVEANRGAGSRATEDIVDEAYPQAILLDLDDTIIDFGSTTESAWQRVCAAAARQVAGLDAAALFATIDRVRTWYWSDPERHRQGRADLRAASRRIVQQALAELGHDLPALAQAIANSYRDLRDEGMSVFAGAVETLQRLRAHGVQLGLVTNGSSTDQRAKLERFDLARHFDHILIEGEFGCGKPDARVYRAALDALRARPADSWFVGDNLEWDVAAPQRLGLRTIWVDAARAGLPANAPVRPHRIIHSLPELL